MDNRPPRYSCRSVNVGLVTSAGQPNPHANPFTNCVLPVPRSPVKASTSPALTSWARRAPAASVSATLAEVNITGAKFYFSDSTFRSELANTRQGDLWKGTGPAP